MYNAFREDEVESLKDAIDTIKFGKNIKTDLERKAKIVVIIKLLKFLDVPKIDRIEEFTKNIVKEVYGYNKSDYPTLTDSYKLLGLPDKWVNREVYESLRQKDDDLLYIYCYVLRLNGIS